MHVIVVAILHYFMLHALYGVGCFSYYRNAETHPNSTTYFPPQRQPNREPPEEEGGRKAETRADSREEGVCSTIGTDYEFV